MFWLVVKIVGALVAVGLGVYWGLPGRYEVDLDELERTMESGVGRTRKVKRHFTPMAWLNRQLSSRGEGHRRRRGFSVERPEDR